MALREIYLITECIKSNDDLLNITCSPIPYERLGKNILFPRHSEQKEGKIKLNQTWYILKIHEKFGLSNCRARSTLCEHKTENNINDKEDNSELINPREYREIVGSLINVMTCYRPDMGWIVSKLSRRLANPIAQDLVAVKHVLIYLKGTTNYELCFKKTDEDLHLIAFSDFDWASSVEDRHSTTGYCFSLTILGPVISWKYKKQPTVALSTCGAE